MQSTVSAVCTGSSTLLNPSCQLTVRSVILLPAWLAWSSIKPIILPDEVTLPHHSIQTPSPLLAMSSTKDSQVSGPTVIAITYMLCGVMENTLEKEGQDMVAMLSNGRVEQVSAGRKHSTTFYTASFPPSSGFSDNGL